MSTLTEIAAFWKKTDKNGKGYLAGRMKDGTPVFIFPVKEKKNEKMPDYRMMAEGEEEKKEPEPPPISESELPF